MSINQEWGRTVGNINKELVEELEHAGYTKHTNLIEQQQEHIAELKEALIEAMRYDWVDQDGAVPDHVIEKCFFALTKND